MQAAVAPDDEVAKDLMQLSLIRRELPRLAANTKQFATMYRRSVALTMNLENENCLQGTIRALSLQLHQLLSTAPAA